MFRFSFLALMRSHAVLHSPGYRSRYAEFLKIDFPRLPLTGNLELFRALARLGGELTALHLLESPLLSRSADFQSAVSPISNRQGVENTTRAGTGRAASGLQTRDTAGCNPALRVEFLGDKNPVVEKPTWSQNTVWLDKAQTTGFRGVREEVWNFHIGGYQVCAKWLKDRKGRTLTKDDLAHYQKIVIALTETIRLMAEIDAVIGQHGGWPLK